jgi:hypothetical protein
MNSSHDPKATMPAQATPEALNSAFNTGKPLPDTQDGGASATPGPDQAPVVAGYELLGQMARGGMGEVWQVRDRRFNRILALKTLQPQYAGSDTAKSRFLAEAQITAQLQHPGIPPVHDLGELPDGRPFLAMKLVKGDTLADLLKQSPRPSAFNYLAVFEAIAQAVGYAHAHGIIHRDLKPANVMVGAFGEVQVMDWGLAKAMPSGAQQPDAPEDPNATKPNLTDIVTPENDVATRTGSILGTPAYMPPEQAGGEIRKLDARSDVFGLGAILCQMLIGQPPYKGTNAHEVRLQAVRWEIGDTFTKLDACGAEPEVIALCKQCLARDQADRPADGNAVAAQVAAIRRESELRAQRAEIAQAQAETQAAEQRKRRRVIQWSAVAIALVLTAGLAGSLWQMNRAMDAERLAQQERDLKETQRQRAQANEKLAEERLIQVEEEKQIATAVSGFLQYKLLGQLDPKQQANRLLALGQPETEREPDPKLSVLVARAAAELAPDKIEANFPRQPLLQAALLQTVGDTYRAIGGKDNDQYALAISFLERSVKLRQQHLGADHPLTLASMNNLALAYQDAGRLAETIRLFEQVRDASEKTLGANHPHTLSTLANLARAYQDAGRLAEALRLFEQVRDARVQKLGADHPATLKTRNNLALAYQEAGRLPEAIRLYEQVRDARVRKLGADHPATLTTLHNLAGAYKDAGRLPQALRLYEQVRDARVRKLGADHPATLTTLHNLARAYQDALRLPEAISLYEQIRSARTRKLGADHPATLTTVNDLAAAYWRAKQLGRSVPLFEHLLPRQEKNLGRHHPDTQFTLANLGVNYKDAGRLVEALPLLEEAYAYSKGHPPMRWVGRPLLDAYVKAGKAAEATALVQELLAEDRKTLPQESRELAGRLATHGLSLLQLKAFVDAEPILRESLDILQKRMEADAPGAGWPVPYTMSLLGEALAGQKRYAEAEPLLVKGYDGLKAREKTIPPQGRARIPEALDRLIALYTALDKPDEVKKWQAERAKFIQKWTAW